MLFSPENFGREQGVHGQVLREDLLVADKVFGGVLNLGSSCDAPRQPGRQTRELMMLSGADCDDS